MSVVDTIHLMMEFVESTGGFSDFNTRNSAHVRDILYPSRGKLPQHIKDLRKAVELDIADSSECGCARTTTHCEHAEKRIAKSVLRAYYTDMETRRYKHLTSQVSLFDRESTPPARVTFDVQSRAFRTVLDVIAQDVRDSAMNVVSKKFDHRGPDGREIAVGFEKWLLDDAIPSLGAECLRHVNTVLAGEFENTGLSVALDSLPFSAPRGDWKDTVISLSFRDTSGNTLQQTAAVNVKYQKSTTGAGNMMGAEGFAHTLLGGRELTKSSTANELIALMKPNLHIEPGHCYSAPDTDYYFWAFERNEEDKPVTESSVSSLLTLDLDRSSEDTSSRSSILKVNAAQSFPHLQLNFAAAGSFLIMPVSALEGRDRVWSWLQPQLWRQATEKMAALSA